MTLVGVRRPLARQVKVDGVRLNVVEAGDGPGLVLLHGLSATHANWEHTLAAFADRWHVVAPDLPGHGDSAKPDAPYTLDFYAGVVRSLGRALGLEDAVVIGNSLGGAIAIELGLTYPRWTRALVLAAPAGGFGIAIRMLRRVIGAAAGPGVLRLALPLALDRCFYDRGSAACAERRRLLALRLAHEDFPAFARAVSRSLEAAVAEGSRRLAAITQPTLVVWGRQDRMVALAGSRRVLREIPHARLAVVDRCGHLPMLERPAEFNGAVAEFLRAVEAAPLPAARETASRA